MAQLPGSLCRCGSCGLPVCVCGRVWCALARVSQHLLPDDAYIEDLTQHSHDTQPDAKQPDVTRVKKDMVQGDKRSKSFNIRGIWVFPLLANTDCWKVYKAGPILGCGAFGTTYQAVKKGTSDQYAVKMISKRNLKSVEEVESIRREVQALQQLTGHRNVVRLEEVYEDKNYVCLVMELCRGGDLHDAIVRRGFLPEHDAAAFMHAIAEAVSHCHRNGVIHRDLKPENFMLSSNAEGAQLKAIDFGHSQLFEEGQLFSETTVSGSIFYLAPEVIVGQYGKAADIWSCGVILHCMLCGYLPFRGKTNEAIMQSICSNPLDFTKHPWPSVSDAAKDLVSSMLHRDPQQRATVEDVMQHPWLRSHGFAPTALQSQGCVPERFSPEGLQSNGHASDRTAAGSRRHRRTSSRCSNGERHSRACTSRKPSVEERCSNGHGSDRPSAGERHSHASGSERHSNVERRSYGGVSRKPSVEERCSHGHGSDRPSVGERHSHASGSDRHSNGERRGHRYASRTPSVEERCSHGFSSAMPSADERPSKGHDSDRSGWGDRRGRGRSSDRITPRGAGGGRGSSQKAQPERPPSCGLDSEALHGCASVPEEPYSQVLVEADGLNPEIMRVHSSSADRPSMERSRRCGVAPYQVGAHPSLESNVIESDAALLLERPRSCNLTSFRLSADWPHKRDYAAERLSAGWLRNPALDLDGLTLERPRSCGPPPHDRLSSADSSGPHSCRGSKRAPPPWDMPPRPSNTQATERLKKLTMGVFGGSKLPKDLVTNVLSIFQQSEKGNSTSKVPLPGPEVAAGGGTAHSAEWLLAASMDASLKDAFSCLDQALCKPGSTDATLQLRQGIYREHSYAGNV